MLWVRLRGSAQVERERERVGAWSLAPLPARSLRHQLQARVLPEVPLREAVTSVPDAEAERTQSWWRLVSRWMPRPLRVRRPQVLRVLAQARPPQAPQPRELLRAA